MRLPGIEPGSLGIFNRNEKVWLWKPNILTTIPKAHEILIVIVIVNVIF